MQSTNPNDISTYLHYIRAGLACGLMTKEEVIDWADEIVTRDQYPDIFFIDLALSSSKSKNDIVEYINEFLNYDKAVLSGRPLLGLLYKEYENEKLNLEQSIKILYRLKFHVLFTSVEEGFIYWIDDAFDLAKDAVEGYMENVQKETESFLRLYKHYTVNNFQIWKDLDENVDKQLEIEHQRRWQQQEKNN
jgi:hypothetical protein